MEAKEGGNSPRCRPPGEIKGGCFSVSHCDGGGAGTGNFSGVGIRRKDCDDDGDDEHAGSHCGCAAYESHFAADSLD